MHHSEQHIIQNKIRQSTVFLRPMNNVFFRRGGGTLATEDISIPTGARG